MNTKDAHKHTPHLILQGVSGEGVMALRVYVCKPGRKPTHNSKRGEVMEFSAQSRRNMRSAIYNIPFPTWRECSFITLTYPVQVEPEKIRRDLRAYWKRTTYRYPGSWCIWCVEIQKRGVYHFHLLQRWGGELDAPVDWKARQKELSTRWAKVVVEDGPRDSMEFHKHEQAGTNMKPVSGMHALTEYLAKPGSKIAGEMSKGSQKELLDGVKPPGRWWGIMGRTEYNKQVRVIRVHVEDEDAWRILYETEEYWEGEYTKKQRETVWYPHYAEGDAASCIMLKGFRIQSHGNCNKKPR